MMTRPLLRISSPADLLAAIPYLLGFHPSDSVVAVGLHSGQVAFIARVDLPGTGDSPTGLARHLCGVLARQDVEAVVLVGYGEPARVDPPMLAIRASLPSHARDLALFDVLRACDGYYWSYLCADPGCCPASGTPFDVSSSEIAAAAAFGGVVALPDRASFVARIAPVEGAARDAMRRATGLAKRRLRNLTGSSARLSAGEIALREAVGRQRSGDRLTDDDVAWLTVLLRQLSVRDRAWEMVTEPDLHVALWTEVVRRAQPELVAAPASLLAFAAWRAGDGPLASVAVERSLACDPTYSMAHLLDDILYLGTSPSTLDDWPTGPSGASGGGSRGPSGGSRGGAGGGLGGAGGRAAGGGGGGGAGGRRSFRRQRPVRF